MLSFNLKHVRLNTPIEHLRLIWDALRKKDGSVQEVIVAQLRRLTTSVTTTFYLEGGAFIKARCLFEQLLGGYGKFFWSFIILYLHRAKMLARMVCGKEVPNGANIKEGLGWGGQNLFD